MSRSIIKGPFVAPGVMRALKRSEEKKQTIRIWSRASVILSSFVGKVAHVYNGKKFIPVSISEAHVGHRFGEFSPTRAQVKHSGVKKAEKSRK